MTKSGQFFIAVLCVLLAAGIGAAFRIEDMVEPESDSIEWWVSFETGENTRKHLGPFERRSNAEQVIARWPHVDVLLCKVERHDDGALLQTWYGMAGYGPPMPPREAMFGQHEHKVFYPGEKDD